MLAEENEFIDDDDDDDEVESCSRGPPETASLKRKSDMENSIGHHSAKVRGVSLTMIVVTFNMFTIFGFNT